MMACRWDSFIRYAEGDSLTDFLTVNESRTNKRMPILPAWPDSFIRWSIRWRILPCQRISNESTNDGLPVGFVYSLRRRRFVDRFRACQRISNESTNDSFLLVILLLASSQKQESGSLQSVPQQDEGRTTN